MKKSVVTIFAYLVIAFSLQAQNRNGEVYVIKEVVNKWNSSHHMSTVNDFDQLYADSVFYYGKSLGRESCIKGKAFWLQHYAGFNQEIVSPIKITFYKSGTIKCSFTKRTTYQQNVEEFEAYLLLEKSGNSYLITGEGDTTSDSRTNTVLNLGEEELSADTTAVSAPAPKVIAPPKESNNFLSPKWIVIPAVILISACMLFFWVFKKNKDHEEEELIYPKANTPAFEFNAGDSDHSDEEEFAPRKKNRKSKAEKKLEQDKLNDEQVKAESIANENLLNEFEEKHELKQGVDPLPVQNVLDPEENDRALQFEQYVISKFDRELFKVISWQRSSSWLPKSGRNPDMEFKVELKSKTVFFAVECKWRQEFYNGQVDLAKESELADYRKYQFQKNIKVFIVLGIGGEPVYPHSVYIIPLDKINSTILEEAQLQRYRRFRNNNFFLDTTMMQLR